MKTYQTNEIRNIALVGGVKSGKTSLAEAMALEGGVISRLGTIEDKNTVSDYREIEMERKASVVSTLLYAEVNGKKINIIDAPGIVDFMGEAVTALNVVESSVMLVNAHTGIEVGTEILWRKAQMLHVPVLFVINQVDHEKADFDECVRAMRESFGEKVVVAQYPVSVGPSFDAIIDLILHKMIKYPKGGGTPEILDIPESEKAKFDEYYKALVEASAQGADDLMEKYFETEDLTIDEMRKGIKLGLASRSIFPVMCVSAKHNKGVARLMEFIGNNVVPPNEGRGNITTNDKQINCEATQPFSAFVFKSAKEAHLGEISYLKIMGGEITEGMDVVNANTGTKERISQLFVSVGKNRIKVEKAVAGDIITTIKLKDIKVNQTLTSAKNTEDIFYPIDYPRPIYTTAIKAVNAQEDEKLSGILHELHQADPTLLVEYSRELKQMIVRGQGEFHINTLKWYLDNIYKIPVQFTSPKIPYRETITKSAEASYKHKKQSGGAGQFGEVHMLIEPYYAGMPNQKKYPIRGTETVQLPWGGCLVFNNCIVGGAIDARFLPAILKGVMEKMEEGPLTGSYARDIVVNVFDGKMHPVDSNELAFKLAGRNAFKEAFKNAGAKILEPIYDVEVDVPTDRMGDVMTDLQSRRAVVQGMESDGSYQAIFAKIPLAEMDKYSTALSSLTSGRATYNMEFFEYAQVPSDIQNQLLKTYELQQTKEEE